MAGRGAEGLGAAVVEAVEAEDRETAVSLTESDWSERLVVLVNSVVVVSLPPLMSPTLTQRHQAEEEQQRSMHLELFEECNRRMAVMAVECAREGRGGDVLTETRIGLWRQGVGRRRFRSSLRLSVGCSQLILTSVSLLKRPSTQAVVDSLALRSAAGRSLLC